MKIFLIGPIKSSFVQNDIKILSRKHKLFLENAAIGKGLLGAWNLLLLTIRSIYKTVFSDALFCWFADYTTLIPAIIAKIFNKKVYVVAGGFDVTNLPEINCGARVRPMRWFCVKNTFRLANKIFPVSNYAKNQLLTLTRIDEKRAKVIYNCIDLEKFSKNNGTNFEREYVLTVSQGDNWVEFIRKGSDKFIELAKKLKNENFILAGLRGEALKLAYEAASDTNNLEIIPGPLDLYKDLIPLYRKSFAYCQLSIDETFGVAVLEAMINGCLPIVSIGGALPEITNGSDAIAVNNEKQLLEAIEKAKIYDESKRENLKAFVQKYDIERRAEILLNEIVGE